MLQLWHRFQRDFKANRPKAAMMAGLLVLGCCFWIPLLAKAVGPKRAAAVTSAPTNPSTTGSNPLPNNIPVADAGTDPFWSSLEEALEHDPLFQSADVGQLVRNPFARKGNIEAPSMPVVTEEPALVPLPIRPSNILPPEVIPMVPPVVVKAEAEPKTLRLTSTIISRSRRAALINGQFIALGRQLNVDGQRYLLTHVDANRVVLSSGEESFELKMARPQLRDAIDRRSGADPHE